LRQLGQEDERIGELRRGNDLAGKQFEFATGKDKRNEEEKHLNEAALRSRLQQLYGKTPSCRTRSNGRAIVTT
jgi:hypothetical protein